MYDNPKSGKKHTANFICHIPMLMIVGADLTLHLQTKH
ncbi:hypothetical protein SPWS13_2091 [Shewanella putrefaciens]|nr:hypothetical protein SPWS13_2091 [Shewanella putrefaciens]